MLGHVKDEELTRWSAEFVTIAGWLRKTLEKSIFLLGQMCSYICHQVVNLSVQLFVTSTFVRSKVRLV